MGENVKLHLKCLIIISILFVSIKSDALEDLNDLEHDWPEFARGIKDDFDLVLNKKGAGNFIQIPKGAENEEDDESSLPSLGKKRRKLGGGDEDTVAEGETIKFVAEWNQTTVDYEFLIELTSEYYCERFGVKHVLCAYKDDRPGLVYYDRGVTTDKVEFILAYLIRLRKRLLLGKETGGNPGPLPPALQLCIVVWSEELQFVAQKLANQLTVTLNNTLVYATDKFTKLSITIAVSKDTLDKPRWTFALNHWYSQVSCVPPSVIYQPDGQYKDYSAMIWGSTFHVGCGYVSVGGKKDTGLRIKAYICVFGPGGNVPGQKIYITHPDDINVIPATPKPNQQDWVTERPITTTNLFDRPATGMCQPSSPAYTTEKAEVITAEPVIVTQPPTVLTTTEAEPETTTTTTPPPPKPTTKEPIPVTTTKKAILITTTKKPIPITTSKKPEPTTTTKKPEPITTTKKPEPITTTKKPVSITTTKKPIPVTTTKKPTPVVTKKPTPKPTKKPPVPKKTTKQTTTAKPSVDILAPIFDPDLVIFDNQTRKFIIQQPYMVLITYAPLKGSKEKIKRCTGVIYNNQWLITSYQCALPTILRDQGKPIYQHAVVYYGEIILNIGVSTDYFRYVVKAVYPSELDIGHTGMFDNLDYSIVLLQLNTAITFSKYTKVIRLAFDSIVYEPKEFAMFLGWKLVEESTKVTVQMHKFHLTIIKESESVEFFSGFHVESRFSAKINKQSQGELTCYTDNGGALVKIVLIDNHQAPVPTAEALLLGISPVTMCERKDAQIDVVISIEYFTKVYKWVSWIKTVAGAQEEIYWQE